MRAGEFQGGFTLLALLAFMAVTTLGLAAAVPAWSHERQREQERAKSNPEKHTENQGRTPNRFRVSCRVGFDASLATPSCQTLRAASC